MQNKNQNPTAIGCEYTGMGHTKCVCTRFAPTFVQSYTYAFMHILHNFVCARIVQIHLVRSLQNGKKAKKSVLERRSLILINIVWAEKVGSLSYLRYVFPVYLSTCIDVIPFHLTATWQIIVANLGHLSSTLSFSYILFLCMTNEFGQPYYERKESM